MTHLAWLPDEVLYSAINELEERASLAREKAGQRMLQNTVDPFTSLMIAHTYRVGSPKELQDLQETASAQSGVASAVGHFHQQILGSIEGWTNHDAGYDLENRNARIVAEIKNKHNTMNATNRNQVQADLDTAVQQKGRNWRGYLVIIIPRTPARYEKRLENCTRPVYEIDGASFYTLATGGVQTALHDLYTITASMLQQKYSMACEISEYCKAQLIESIP